MKHGFVSERLLSIRHLATRRYAEKSSPKFAKQYHRSLIYQEWPQYLDDVDVVVLGMTMGLVYRGDLWAVVVRRLAMRT